MLADLSFGKFIRYSPEFLADSLLAEDKVSLLKGLKHKVLIAFKDPISKTDYFGSRRCGDNF